MAALRGPHSAKRTARRWTRNHCQLRPIPSAPERPFTPFGETVTYYLQALEEQGLADLDRLPFTVRILLENALRHAGGEFVDRELVAALAAEAATGELKLGDRVPFLPGRVVLQDFTGCRRSSTSPRCATPSAGWAVTLRASIRSSP